MGADFDLNLIRTFVLLYEQRSVTATANALHVTQPTVSYSLQKLRRRFADELFVRRAQGVIPTARAVALYEPLRAALASIELSVESTRTFDAATSTARFSIAMSDIGELSLLPPILDAMLAAAPSTGLAVLPLDIDEAEGELIRGEIDAFVASPVLGSDRITRIPLFREGYWCVVRQGHPRIRGASASAAQLATERLVSVVGHSGHLPPIRAIHTEGLVQNVALEISRFAALPNLLARTDLVALVPHNVAEVFKSAHALKLFEPPWHVDTIEVALYTRHPHGRSAAQNWLTDLIVAQLRHLGGPTDDAHDQRD